MINLNQLLDEDHLTPAQERFIRRLFDYTLSRDKNNKYVLEYSSNYGEFTGTRLQDIKTDSLSSLKEVAYKEVMLQLIDADIDTVTDPMEIKKVKTLLEESVIDQNAEAFIIELHDDSTVWVREADYLKSQNLYKVVEILVKAVALENQNET